MKTIIPVLLIVGIATLAMLYCAKAHSDGFYNPYNYNYGARPRVIGPNPTGMEQGLTPGEFGSLYIMQQQQMLDIQRQQLQLQQQQRSDYQNQMRMQIMMDAFGNR